MAARSWAIVLACLVGIALLHPASGRAHRRLVQHPAVKPSPDPQYKGLCAVEGPAADATWMNASRTCNKLYSSGAPIRVPADTNTTKWGQVFIQSFSPIVSVFIDRHGNTFNINPSANPPTDELQLMQIWTLLVVKAELVNGNVSRFTPVLYVPYSTIMSTMINTTFEGQLYNSNPRPVGPAQYSWFRWTFGDKIIVTNATQKYGTLLHGTFDNLFTPVKDSKGKCQPALCSDPSRTSAACKYYLEFFGNSTAMTLNWDPNMHAPVDTELVPMFTTTHRQYMASFMELYNLLVPYQFVPHRIMFIGHGNPMGVPQNFVGSFKAGATKAIPCKI